MTNFPPNQPGNFPPNSTPQNHTIFGAADVSLLSGTSMFCLDKMGYQSGGLVIGNTVYSRGFGGNFASDLKSMGGGENPQITAMVSEARHIALKRLYDEVAAEGGAGAVNIELRQTSHTHHMEFTVIGNAIKSDPTNTSNFGPFFTNTNAESILLNTDAGYIPKHVAIGNFAYTLGLGRGLAGMFKQFTSGEITQYSHAMIQARMVAIGRMIAEAQNMGANSIVNIGTEVTVPHASITDVLFYGTASFRESSFRPGFITTSNLSSGSLWNLAKLGFSPVQVVYGASVISLGIGGGIGSSFRNLSQGEIPQITKMIYEARSNVLQQLHNQAHSVGAEQVIGVEFNVGERGEDLLEVTAIGTAIVKDPGAKTNMDQIPTQILI